MTSYLPTALWSLPAPRHLTLTKQLPHPRATIFAVLSSFSSYQHFLPLTTASTILSRDSHGKTKTFRMKIGYPDVGVSEEWRVEVVQCDEVAGKVELKRGSESGGVIESWTIKFGIVGGKVADPMLKVDLDIRFASAVWDQMFWLTMQDGLLGGIVEAVGGRCGEVEAGVERERVKAEETKAKEKTRVGNGEMGGGGGKGGTVDVAKALAAASKRPAVQARAAAVPLAKAGAAATPAKVGAAKATANGTPAATNIPPKVLTTKGTPHPPASSQASSKAINGNPAPKKTPKKLEVRKDKAGPT